MRTNQSGLPEDQKRISEENRYLVEGINGRRCGRAEKSRLNQVPRKKETNAYTSLGIDKLQRIVS